MPYIYVPFIPKISSCFFPQRLGLPGVFEFDQLAGAIVGSGATESWVNDDKSYVKSTLLILTNHEVGSLGGSRKMSTAKQICILAENSLVDKYTM
jgi:hypothetical protein